MKRPTYITADGRYDLAAIMRRAHYLFRTLSPNFPNCTFAGQLHAVWREAQREMRSGLIDRIAGRNRMLATCISLASTSELRREAATMGV